MLIQSLEKKVRLAFMTVIIMMIGCISICGTCFFFCTKLVTDERKQIYVLNGKVPLMAERTPDEVNLEVECKSHVQIFHQYFFTLAPDDKYIKWTLEKAMYLIDESGLKQKNSMQEKGFYSDLLAASAVFSIMCDSVRMNMDKMTFIYYGTQRIERRTSTLTRLLVTAGSLRRVPRTENNPHGLLITNWRTLENKDLEYKQKNNLE